MRWQRAVAGLLVLGALGGLVLFLDGASHTYPSEPPEPGTERPQPGPDPGLEPGPGAGGARAPSAAGVVLSAADLTPVAGARVEFGEDPLLVAVTDGTGEWSLTTVPRGWSVRITAVGFALHEEHFRRRPPVDGVVRVSTILLEPSAATVKGRVVDPAGRPVMHAELQVDCSTFQLGDAPWRMLGPEGRFGPISAPVGTLYLSAQAPGYPITNLTLEIQRGVAQREITVVLTRGVPLRGSVVDEEGSPVAGARVYADGHDAQEGQHPVESGPDGRFVWFGREGEEVGLRAKKEGYLLSMQIYAVPGSELLFVLRRGAFLEGRLLLPGGRAVSGLSLSVLPRKKGAFARATGRTGEDGGFRLGPLEGGAYEIVVVGITHDLSYVRGRFPVGLESAEVKSGLDLVLAPPTRIEGLVVDAVTGEPVVGAETDASSFADEGRAAKTDRNGRFVVAGIPADMMEKSFRVLVRKSGYSLAVATFSGPGPHDARIALSPIRSRIIRVRVVDEDGRPVAGAKVVAVRPDESEGYLTAVPADGQGRAVLAVPPNASVSLRAQLGNRGSARIRVRAGSESEVAVDGALRLAQGAPGNICIRVLDVEDAPVFGARLSIAQSNPRIWLDSGKGGEIHGNVPSSWLGVLHAPGFAPARLRSDDLRGYGPHVVALRPALPIAGRVLDDAGRPLQGVTVTCLDNEGLLQESEVRTDSFGRFEIGAVPIGEVAGIGACRNGYPGQVRWAAPGDPPLEFRIPRRGKLRIRSPAGRADGGAPGKVEMNARWLDPEIPAGYDEDDPHEVRDDEILFDLPAGLHIARFRRAPDGWRYFRTVEVPPDGVATLDYGDPSPGRLSGRVLGEGGKPVPDAGFEDEFGTVLAVTDEKGRIVPRSGIETPCGVLRFRVAAEAYPTLLTDWVDLSRDVPLDIRLRRGGRIRLTVHCHRPLLPVASTMILTTHDRRSDWDWIEEIPLGAPFLFPDPLLPGLHRVEVRVPGYYPVVTEVDVKAGKTSNAKVTMR